MKRVEYEQGSRSRTKFNKKSADKHKQVRKVLSEYAVHARLFYDFILTASAVSPTNLGSKLLFASCVIHISHV